VIWATLRALARGSSGGGQSRSAPAAEDVGQEPMAPSAVGR